METNQRKLGIVLSYIGILTSAVVNMINVPLFLRFIGVDQYGIYQTMGALISYFSVLDFGLPSTIVVFYSRYKGLNDKRNMENILAICSRIYIAITAVILAVSAVLYFFLDSMYSESLTREQLISTKQVYIVLIINVAFTLPFQILNAIITASERFVFIRGTTIFVTILQALGVALVIFKFPYALSIVIVQTIFNLIVVVLRYFYCFKVLKVKIKFHFFDAKLFKSIVKYSFFIFLNVIVEQLFWRSSAIILSVFCNPESVAAYSIAFQISYYYMIISTAITGVFLPKITKMVSSGATNKELGDIFLRVGRVQFIILSCVLTGFILFGKQFISLWSLKKPGFEDSYLMTLFIIIPLTFDLVQGLAQTILQAVNKFYIRVLLFLFINVVNVLIMIPLSKLYGGVICAVLNGFGILALVFILNFIYQNFLNLKMLPFWSQILKMCLSVLCCFVVGATLNFVYMPSEFLSMLFKIFSYTVIYIVVMWKFAMNSYEKSLLKKPVEKLKNMIIAHKKI